ncbi:MAG: hypothetical protein ABI335_01570 [Polyangiaceae bacterium]
MIRKRLTVATAVVGAFLMLGCGKTRDVNDVAPSATGGDGGATGGDGVATGGDGVATGGSHSDGGSGQVGHVGGAPTWDPLQCHVEPVPEPSDPTAAEQWSLARKYCVALGTQDCLLKTAVVFNVGGCTSDEALEACVAQVLWVHYSNVSSECEDVWRKDIECGANSTFGTPPLCDGVGTFGPYGSTETCTQENAALSDCMGQHSPYVEVRGSYATCLYQSASVSALACNVTCQLGQYSAELDCSGPEGLPKQCGCKINGHVVTNPDPIFVSDCADAAGQAADGLCTGTLDCCFESLEQNKQMCRCEVPAEYGYDSCEAMMAVAQGRRVDICPALLPDNSGGWPPGN